MPFACGSLRRLTALRRAAPIVNLDLTQKDRHRRHSDLYAYEFFVARHPLVRPRSEIIWEFEYDTPTDSSKPSR